MSQRIDANNAPSAKSLKCRLRATAVAGKLLRRAARHLLVEQRLLVAVFPQDPPETLHIFPRRSRARQYDADAGRRNIHALIQNLARDHDRILARVKPFENLLSLLGLGLMRNGRDQESAADARHRGAIVG